MRSNLERKGINYMNINDFSILDMQFRYGLPVGYFEQCKNGHILFYMCVGGILGGRVLLKNVSYMLRSIALVAIQSRRGLEEDCWIFDRWHKSSITIDP
jgi:hypothetical protein